MLRDQPISVFSFQADSAKRKWIYEEITVVQAICEQFALVAESLRLLNEAQRRATREHRVSESTTLFRWSNNPQNMFRIAAQELRKAFRENQLDENFSLSKSHQNRGDE